MSSRSLSGKVYDLIKDGEDKEEYKCMARILLSYLLTDIPTGE